jgi:hypothetical protein
MNYYLQQLSRIAPLDGHRVEVSFADDHFTAALDLLPWVQRGGVRAALTDPAVFAEVTVGEFGEAEWPGEIDLSPGTLRAWCEAGRVLTKEETDAWIAQHTRTAQSVA